MDNTKQSPTVLSFCSGYSGIELGLERAIGRINVLAHVEIEAFAIANLVSKMETGRMVPAPIWTNVKTLNPEIFRGHIDILTGGYPCQPFSAAGKRLGSDDPRHLWPYIREHIRIIKPGWIFLENVEGHLSKGIVQVLSDLEEMAYRVECGVFSASEVGAPHQRKRVFILGNSEGNDEWRLSLPTMYREGVEVGGSGCELANTRRIRGEQPGAQLSKELNRNSEKWPARPGEPQYEWEEPRVVAQPEKKGLQEPFERAERVPPRQSGPEHMRPRQIKPQLGRVPDGNTDRVDRLRLLGNGVVPATAEKAFIVLHNKLINTVTYDRT